MSFVECGGGGSCILPCICNCDGDCECGHRYHTKKIYSGNDVFCVVKCPYKCRLIKCKNRNCSNKAPAWLLLDRLCYDCYYESR